MNVIGLTGGIASGKSTAAEILRELGATVIDADRLGHRSYEPGTPGFEKVVNAFGHDLVDKDGLIDRRILGGKVFGAPGQMERLNAIVWPEIRNLIREEVDLIKSQDSDAIVVLEAAVLLEAGWQDLCDEIWVVTTPIPTAVERLRSRNNLSEDAAMARINAQMSNKERADAASVKIENAGTEEQLRTRVERAWDQLIQRVRPKAKKRDRRPAAPNPAASKARASASKSAPAAKTPKASPARASSPKSAPKAAAATKTAPARATTKAASAKPVAREAAGKPAVAKVAAKPATRAASPSAKKAASTSKPASKPVAQKAAATAKPAPKKAATAKKAAPAKPATKAARPAAKASVAKPAAGASAKPAARAAAAARTAAKPAAKAPAKPATRVAAKKTAPTRGASTPARGTTRGTVKGTARAARPAARAGGRK
jgi:phosphopantetheine adenylyltransferase/dephospho-CoA kinase